MKLYDELTPALIAWMKEQHVFFVSSAPLNGKYINLSPKGLQKSLAVISATQVAYLDTVGSGNETLSHLQEDGNRRLCMMFCALDGAPKILRLHCYGEYLCSDSTAFHELVAQHFDTIPSNIYRGLVLASAFSISMSCGMGVPQFTFTQERTELGKVLHKMNNKPDKFIEKVLTMNKTSLDGLPGIQHTKYLDVPPQAPTQRSPQIPTVLWSMSSTVVLVSIILAQQIYIQSVKP